ncbi:hypothetical protein B0H21DRAFT_781365 [Amylocystis lapponica]|nr:hypothetical protein B0H21DRAFT_781365 [Amylocystis lapponica]
MAQPIIYRTPPIAGRPPYATDEPDSQAPPDPNARTSAYNNPFDDMKDAPSQPRIPLAAPRPGYAAPVAALNLSRPSPTATPKAAPRDPPMTPIAPAFIRPSNSPGPRDVKFASGSPILRGNSEETLLPKRGQQGEDFWRRFSMVAKEDTRKPQSQWLKKTMSGTSRMSRWVFLIGIILLLVVVGAIGLGVYVSHKNPHNSAPTAIGGSADETGGTSSSLAGHEAVASSSTFLHVTPTNTVARRDDIFKPMSTGVPLALPLDHSGGPIHLPRIPLHHRRSHLNRTSH